MFEIGGQYNGRQIIIPVIIGGLSNGGFQLIEANALLDTGATSSGIAAGIADKLSLESLGRRVIGTAGGTRRASTYKFSLAFAPSVVTSLGVSGDKSPQFLPNEVQGIDFTEGLDFQIVLGMDIISTGELIIRKNRFWSLQF